MSNLKLEFRAPAPATHDEVRQPIGRILLENGLITKTDLRRANELRKDLGVSLSNVLISENFVSADALARATASQLHLQFVDLSFDPPNQAMSKVLTVENCLDFGVVPWRMLGKTVFVATNQPHEFDHFAAAAARDGLLFMPVIATQSQINDHITLLFGDILVDRAATRVPVRQSCRTMKAGNSFRLWGTAVLLTVFSVILIISPTWTLTVLTLWALLCCSFIVCLRCFALISHILSSTTPVSKHREQVVQANLPKVSMLVPLLHEKEIANALINRLQHLSYPKALFQVVLVLEQGDTVTRDTLKRTQLPQWFDVIEVPQAGSLRTKPRALNYALDFCNGSIVGVWDAEDAPEPDQIEQVVHHFANASKDVACVQGILDYYNAHTNWISRCFTLEYASWWRVILPGIARLGAVIPLGGTTFFFRRNILESLFRWDAYNVTEDADLGVRLARYGFKTELLQTTTFEEANFRIWPWIKQRSRWLKGFLITWCVHMRSPLQLLRDVGLRPFIGIQTVFLATVSQFLFAPLLWSFCITLFGATHPVEEVLGSRLFTAFFWFFICAEGIYMTIALKAASYTAHRGLKPWVLALPFYFILGTFAAYKALYEFIISPFYWDKTAHGVHIARVDKQGLRTIAPP